MTRRTFLKWIWIVIGIYAFAIAAGILIRIWRPTKDDIVYETFKDLVPLIIAAPAAWLGYCFQRRSSFQEQLRSFWSALVVVVQDAIQYTHLQSPTQADFSKIVCRLSYMIEELRGIYLNIGEAPSDIGLYPYESLKELADALHKLGFGEKFTTEKADATRSQIVDYWKKVRRQLLREFDRVVPTYVDSPYVRGDDA